jgi:hypothetical protein
MREGSRQSACPCFRSSRIFLNRSILNRSGEPDHWNDQRDSPLGNTVNPAPMDVSAGDAPRVLLGGLQEAIGLVLDLTNRQVFLTDLGGSLSDLSPTQTKYGRCRNSVDALQVLKRSERRQCHDFTVRPSKAMPVRGLHLGDSTHESARRQCARTRIRS